MPEPPPAHGRQFSLRSLMIGVTIACVVLAMPQGWLLLTVGMAWTLLAGLIAWPLVAFYGPIYRWIAGRATFEGERPIETMGLGRR
jgi:hypothetical protein